MADLDQDVTKNVNDNSEKDSNRISVKSFYPAIEEYIKKYYIEPIESFGNLSVPSLGSKAKSTTKRTLRKTRDVFSVKRADLREEKQEICSLEKEEAVIDAADECFDKDLLSRSLTDVMKEVDETFSERLLRLAAERNLTNVEIYKRANIRRQLFSKIISNKDYQPKKETAIVLALALHLNLDETKDFLSRAGYALSRSNQRDLVIKFFIENGYYDVLDIDQALYDHGLEPLSTTEDKR